MPEIKWGIYERSSNAYQIVHKAVKETKCKVRTFTCKIMLDLNKFNPIGFCEIRSLQILFFYNNTALGKP